LEWLSPSHWKVEAQLEALKNRRHNNTLAWALEMPEFKTWQSLPGSKESILWICGAAGVGKSVMASFLINHLRASFPNSIHTYFFAVAERSS
jgi:chromosomal replication initiation ATPase DnaA